MSIILDPEKFIDLSDSKLMNKCFVIRSKRLSSELEMKKNDYFAVILIAFELANLSSTKYKTIWKMNPKHLIVSSSSNVEEFSLIICFSFQNSISSDLKQNSQNNFQETFLSIMLHLVKEQNEISGKKSINSMLKTLTTHCPEISAEHEYEWKNKFEHEMQLQAENINQLAQLVRA